jgi:hypothetical protein
VIEEIRKKFAAGQFEFSKHAVDQSILRHITVQEVRDVIGNGEIIEDYLNDKYGPSCGSWPLLVMIFPLLPPYRGDGVFFSSIP